MLIDLHTHTYPKSDDSFLAPEALFQHAKEVGLDGVCLTEHDGFWEPEMLAQWSQQYGLVILPGCEVTTEEGHLLVFGLDHYIFGMHRARFVKELVNQAQGVLVVAHPYRRQFQQDEARDPTIYDDMVRRACENSVFSMADAVEVLNARGSQKENAFSYQVSYRFHLPGTGASDAHQVSDIGTFATEFANPISDLGDLIQELREGRFRAATLRTPWAAQVVDS